MDLNNLNYIKVNVKQEAYKPANSQNTEHNWMKFKQRTNAANILDAIFI